jgi:hypothetical protein
MKLPYLLALVIATSSLHCALYNCDKCDSYFQFGVNYTHVNIAIQDESNFHGNLGGLQGSYEYRPRNNFYGGVQLKWKQGNTSGSHQSRYLIYIDAQEKVGYTFAYCKNSWFLTPFSGLGYRHLNHKLKQSDEPTLTFHYDEIYIPVGFLSGYFFNRCWSLGLNFTWMAQVYPNVQIDPLKGARWVLNDTLANFLVELPLTYSFTDSQHYFLIFKPFYEHWEDGHSTAKMSNGTPLGLPGNTYNFWGAELNFAYSF